MHLALWTSVVSAEGQSVCWSAHSALMEHVLYMHINSAFTYAFFIVFLCSIWDAFKQVQDIHRNCDGKKDAFCRVAGSHRKCQWLRIRYEFNMRAILIRNQNRPYHSK